MQVRTLTALAMISLFAAIPLFAAGPASANSALDQYVEQVPGPGGNTNVDGNNPGANGKNPAIDSLDPTVRNKLESSGEAGVLLARLANASAPTLVSTEPTSGSLTKAGSKGSVPDNTADREKMGKLLVADTPGVGNSMTAAVGTSGINGPLAIFVVVVALLMGGVAYRRHLRSNTR